MRNALRSLVWLLLALLGAWAYYHIATIRHEPLNSGYILVAALCTYTIGYRFYGKWVAARVLALDDRRATPCEAHEDGKDFVKTNKWIVFGHHFAAISGPGPLVGPVLAAQFGYLPGTLWILIGAVLGGAVQDFVILFASIRRDGKSLGQMLKEELSNTAGLIGLVAILAILVILLAVLALIVVKAMAESPWSVFTVGATIPIAMLMGGYLRFVRVGKVLEVSVIGVILLLLAVWGGQFVHASPEWSRVFTKDGEWLARAIILYGLAASVLPVWLLLAPRDYLSTFMKLGTIFALVAGVLLVLPDLRMPAMSVFANGSGLIVSGPVFPFCFITIACGVISGFHTLIASGVTPKIITRETHARPVGYGAMLLESLVAVVAMIAACTLEPSVYLAMNVQGTGATQEAVATSIKAKVEKTGFTALVSTEGGTRSYAPAPVQVSQEEMGMLAAEMGEKTLFGRTGGAATLAVGMAQIFSKVTHGVGLNVWYHFALMFEALFILTTIDAGTRVGRYLLQDLLGSVWKPLGDTANVKASVAASALVVAGWGAFLLMGVRDPEGGVKALWPIFGIANQLLAGIALCLATTILLKTVLLRRAKGQRTSLALCLVTGVPLVVLLAITLTAGTMKVADPRYSFFAGARTAESALQAAEAKLVPVLQSGEVEAIAAAQKAVKNARTALFNNRVDGVVTLAFLVLVVTITVLSIWEWVRLLSGRKEARLRETEAVYLPPGKEAIGAPISALGTAALALTMLKELSGEAAQARAQAEAKECACVEGQAMRGRQHVFLTSLEERYKGVRRCC